MFYLIWSREVTNPIFFRKRPFFLHVCTCSEFPSYMGNIVNAVLYTLCSCFILVFEPGDEGKNEVEYKKIFDDYKNLVRIYF